MGGQAALSVEVALYVAATALAVLGALVTLKSRNAIKKLVGMLIAGFGAMASLAVMGAPAPALAACAAVLLAQTAIGAAIVIRLQESYGATETPDIDVADAETDAQDPSP